MQIATPGLLGHLIHMNQLGSHRTSQENQIRGMNEKVIWEVLLVIWVSVMNVLTGAKGGQDGEAGQRVKERMLRLSV